MLRIGGGASRRRPQDKQDIDRVLSLCRSYRDEHNTFSIWLDEKTKALPSAEDDKLDEQITQLQVCYKVQNFRGRAFFVSAEKDKKNCHFQTRSNRF